MQNDTMDRAGLAARNADLLRSGYEAFGRGDLATVQKLFDPAVVWHAKRLGLLGGDHEGWEAVAQFFMGTMELTEGTFRTVPQEILSNENYVAALSRSTAERGGRTLDDLQVHVFRMRDGKVTEIWQYPGDPDAVERFWS